MFFKSRKDKIFDAVLEELVDLSESFIYGKY